MSISFHVLLHSIVQFDKGYLNSGAALGRRKRKRRGLGSGAAVVRKTHTAGKDSSSQPEYGLRNLVGRSPVEPWI
ncbi:hypothetical protein E3N88_18773 [Mikania micrantha]|uniref:Uncharacterized protein n=1 Tax=Mikania micrantha TaxID=192012 RepID=A0A5N6NPB9_9ASTR|nr:hypothetical protein E3N88_18773 [Mikania micrantha]